MFYPRPVQLLQCVRNPDHEDCRLCPSSMETSWNRVLHTFWFFYYYHLCVKLEKTWLHSLEGQIVLWCTEPITSSPCCDTNSQVAGGGTLRVIPVHTWANKCTVSRGPGTCSMVEGWSFVLFSSLLCSSHCAQSTRAGLAGAFPVETQLAVISVLPQKGWKGNGRSTWNIPQQGILPSGTRYRHQWFVQVRGINKGGLGFLL